MRIDTPSKENKLNFKKYVKNLNASLYKLEKA